MRKLSLLVSIGDIKVIVYKISFVISSWRAFVTGKKWFLFYRRSFIYSILKEANKYL